MAGDLYPTKSRLALLAAIDRGEVLSGMGPRDTEIENYWVDAQPPHDSTKVTARVSELERAGWVQRDQIDTPSLTDAGREVLALDRIRHGEVSAGG